MAVVLCCSGGMLFFGLKKMCYVTVVLCHYSVNLTMWLCRYAGILCGVVSFSHL